MAAVKYCDLDDNTTPMTTAACWAILMAPDAARVSDTPPIRPKAGAVYVFRQVSESKKKDFKCDHYFWKWKNQHPVPTKNPQMIRIIYDVRTNSSNSDSGFRRIFMESTVSDYPYSMVMYVGDESVAPAQNPSHGNRKSGQRPFVPQASSVKETILEQYTGQMPATLYQKLGAKPHSNEAVFVPRDMEKVRNVVKHAKRQGRLSHDALYNLYELSHRLSDGFVAFMQLVPSFICHLIYIPFYQEVKDVLALPRGSFDKAPLFSYDTTFQVGDFYLSVIIFRHTYFVNNPVFPVAFMLHDRKYHKDHENFVSEVLKDLVPPSSDPVALVTDREFAFKNLPFNVKHIYCWRHIFDNVVRAVPPQSARSPREVAGDVQRLLKTESEEKFEELCLEMEPLWNEEFRKFFRGKLKNCLVQNAARWVLETLGVYNPISGVTTNQSESMNAKIQRLIDWRERPVDVAALFLYHLSKYYHHEITRGKHGLGEYKPKSGYDLLPVEMMPSHDGFIVHPDQLVDYLQDPNSIQPPSVTAETSTVDDPDAVAMEAAANATSRMAMAKAAIWSKKVGCDFKTGSWVISEGEKPHVVAYGVRLQPDKCSCGATRVCYHVMAARMAAGLPVNPNVGKPSVTAAYKRSKKAADRRSGRKKGRPADYQEKSNDEKPSTDAHLPAGQAISQAMMDEVPVDGILVVSRQTGADVSATSAEVAGHEKRESTNDVWVDAAGKQYRNLMPPRAANLMQPVLDLHPAKKVAAYGKNALSTLSTTGLEPLEIDGIFPRDPVRNLPLLMPWGPKEEGLINTCPIDNPVGIFYLASLVSANFLNDLRNSATEPEQAIYRMVGLIKQQKYVAAKHEWCRVLKREPFLGVTNLWGEELDLLDRLEVAYTAYGLDECSNHETCPEPTKYEETGLLFVTPWEPVEDQIVDKYDDHQENCTITVKLSGTNRAHSKLRKVEDLLTGEMVSVRECSGTRTISDLKVHSSLWFYPLGLHLPSWSLEEAFKLPKLLSILGKVVHLRGLTVSEKKRSHYTAYVLWKGKFYYYYAFNNGELTDDLPLQGDPWVAYYTP